MKRNRKVKIVATLGPASSDEKMSWMVQLTEPVSNNPALNTPLVTGAPTK